MSHSPHPPKLLIIYINHSLELVNSCSVQQIVVMGMYVYTCVVKSNKILFLIILTGLIMYHS